MFAILPGGPHARYRLVDASGRALFERGLPIGPGGLARVPRAGQHDAVFEDEVALDFSFYIPELAGAVEIDFLDAADRGLGRAPL